MVGRVGLHTVRASLPPHLELGQLGVGQSMLLLQIDDADDDALDALHLAIAEAFVALGRVTFLEDVERPTLGTLWRKLWSPGHHRVEGAEWTPEEDGTRHRRIVLRSAFGAAGAVGTAPVELGLTSTVKPEVAARLFEFSGWFQGAQLVLLSKAAAPAPGVDDRFICTLAAEKNWSVLDALPVEDKMTAAAFPGVDGALMGVIALGDTDAQAIADALTGRFTAHGLPWQVHAPAETLSRYGHALAQGA
ncbi:hypothetical protein RT97_27015 [Variovorax paradoxus]|uniref:Uncharacterized protein n=1 Tax=Variovorax paradoxus TaxID=34073 RepID=A0A0D0LWU5_VARPD|nr:hypothetical protein [Variovorax paradoxus]KIQ21930.1 hypothetical protein RT97_27015 [Variovorax paradoxus]